ncbi:MAG: DUF4197 domain-containing protein [Sulfurimonas sp.]
MKTLSIVTSMLLASTVAFSFDFGALANDALNSATQTTKPTNTSTKTSSSSSLSESTVTSGLKEALKVGVDFGVKTLSKKDGYLNNASVKIPLPDKLAKVESMIRKVGGDKLADDLIHSMNTAATEAAPKTAAIFVDAVDKMSMQDAKQILAGGDDAATQYFQKNTTSSLQAMIKPIIQKSMKENDVAKYYDSFNEFYTSNVKGLVENNSMMSMAKSFGADEYLPSQQDAKLDDFVTQKAIDGLFKMIANKESEIRKDPVAQTTSLLKKVFGN